MEIRHSTQVPQEEWDSMLRCSDDVWLWHSWTWIEAMARIYSLENHYFIATQNRRNVGGLPLQLTRRWLYGRKCNIADSLFMGPAGPFCITGPPSQVRQRILSELTMAAIDWARETSVERLFCSLPPLAPSNLANTRGVNPLLTVGWRDASTHTLIANLSKSESDLWLDLTHDARRSVRLARTAGYSVEEANWLEMLDEYYRVHQETFRRADARNVSRPKEYYEEYAKMQEQGKVVLWVGLDPGRRPVAFHSDARFRDGSYYATGCSETDHLRSGVNYLLFWHALVRAKQDGCAWYDIGEIYPGTEYGKEKGVSLFKGKFGGELYRYYRGEIRFFDWPPQSLRSVAAILPTSVRSSLNKLMARRE